MRVNACCRVLGSGRVYLLDDVPLGCVADPTLRGLEVATEVSALMDEIGLGLDPAPEPELQVAYWAACYLARMELR